MTHKGELEGMCEHVKALAIAPVLATAFLLLCEKGISVQLPMLMLVL